MRRKEDNLVYAVLLIAITFALVCTGCGATSTMANESTVEALNIYSSDESTLSYKDTIDIENKNSDSIPKFLDCLDLRERMNVLNGFYFKIASDACKDFNLNKFDHKASLSDIEIYDQDILGEIQDKDFLLGTGDISEYDMIQVYLPYDCEDLIDAKCIIFDIIQSSIQTLTQSTIEQRDYIYDSSETTPPDNIDNLDEYKKHEDILKGTQINYDFFNYKG